MTEQRVSSPVPPEPQVPARETGKMRWRFSHEIRPNFWEPGLIDGVLELKGKTVVYGPSSVGKTAVVVDMALRIAAGLPWRGHATHEGLVVYIAAENHWSTEARIWAWRHENGFGDQRELPFLVTESSVQLGGDDTDAVVADILAMVTEAQDLVGKKAVLVVVDTLARTMVGDENTQTDMGRYVAQIERIEQAIDGHLLVVHHTGKDEDRGARGSSALRAAVDHEIALSKDSGSQVGALKMTKIREGGLEGKRYGFELSPRDLGVNKLGRMNTTIVVKEADAPAERKTARANMAQDVEAYIRGQGGRATIEEIMGEFGQMGKGSAESSKRAWSRMLHQHFRPVMGYWTLKPAPEAADNPADNPDNTDRL